MPAAIWGWRPAPCGSSGRNLFEKKAASSGPVAPTNMVSSAVTALPMVMPPRPRTLEAGDRGPGDGDDEEAKHQLEHGIGQLHHEPGAGDRASQRAEQKRHRDVKAYGGALVPGAAGIGAELNRAVDRYEGSDGQEHAHQGKHGDAAADAEGGGQGRGEEGGDDQERRRRGAEVGGKETGKRLQAPDL